MRPFNTTDNTRELHLQMSLVSNDHSNLSSNAFLPSNVFWWPILKKLKPKDLRRLACISTTIKIYSI